MNILPSSLSVIGGFERINESDVIVPEILQIRNEDFALRSVVIAETNKDDSNLMISSSTLIKAPNYSDTSFILPNYYCYDPYAPNKGNTIQNPINEIYLSNPTLSLSFTTLAEKRGMVYIYTNKLDNEFM
jgi:hypothetical protein